jgi:hypothetical protein
MDEGKPNIHVEPLAITSLYSDPSSLTPPLPKKP